MLVELGYPSSPLLQAIWESDAFDGTTTPSLHDNPSYDEWRYQNLRGLAKHSGVPDDQNESVLSYVLMIDRSWTIKAVPGACQLIHDLRRRGKKIGLCSNWDYVIQPYLVQAQLPEFDSIVVSAEVGARKPHANIFHSICAKLDVEPSKAVFVGDSWSSDIVGALRVGIQPVWIRKNRPSAGVPYLVHEFLSIEELARWIEENL